jgi:hypothetical protein
VEIINRRETGVQSHSRIIHPGDVGQHLVLELGIVAQETADLYQVLGSQLNGGLSPELFLLQRGLGELGLEFFDCGITFSHLQSLFVGQVSLPASAKVKG